MVMVQLGNVGDRGLLISPSFFHGHEWQLAYFYFFKKIAGSLG